MVRTPESVQSKQEESDKAFFLFSFSADYPNFLAVSYDNDFDSKVVVVNNKKGE